QQGDIEHRLGNSIIGAGFHLVFKAPDLFIDIANAGVGAHADGEARAVADGVAANVQAEVQVVNNVHQADGIHVEHRRGVRVVAKLGRVAGDTDQVVDTHGVAAQELGLHAEHIAVATRKVQRGFYTCLLLHQDAKRQVAQAGGGAGAI